jgi:hypothetical protein
MAEKRRTYAFRHLCHLGTDRSDAGSAPLHLRRFGIAGWRHGHANAVSRRGAHRDGGNRGESRSLRAGANVLACKPCAQVRHIGEANLDKRNAMAGMNEFHAAAARDDARVVSF